MGLHLFIPIKHISSGKKKFDLVRSRRNLVLFLLSEILSELFWKRLGNWIRFCKLKYFYLLTVGLVLYIDLEVLSTSKIPSNYVFDFGVEVPERFQRNWGREDLSRIQRECSIISLGGRKWEMSSLRKMVNMIHFSRYLTPVKSIMQMK